jgi:hypothetical protein
MLEAPWTRNLRHTSRNLARLKRFAAVLGVVVLRPYYPVSDFCRVVRDDDGLQVDLRTNFLRVRVGIGRTAL